MTLDKELITKAYKLYQNKEYFDEIVSKKHTYKKLLPGCNVKFYFNSDLGKYYLVGSFICFAIIERGLKLLKDGDNLETDEILNEWRKVNRQTEFCFQQLRKLC